MGEPLTDGVLVQRAGRGDSIAFSELVHRHYRRAMRVAYGLVRSAQDAEDLAQEAFARVHARLPELAGASVFYIWVYRILVNLCIDRARRRRREGAVVAWDMAGPEPGGSHPRLKDTAAPSSRQALPAAQEGTASKLREAFAQLPEIYQAVLLLRDLEGFSYDEIAVTLQLKRGTVMSRLFYARKAMQLQLHGASPDKKAAPEADA